MCGVLLLCLVVGIKVAGLLFGFGISFPPNACDLKVGYELHGDLVHSSRDLCLLKKGIQSKDINICNEILTHYQHTKCVTTIAADLGDYVLCEQTRNNRDFKRSDARFRLNEWECWKEVALKLNSKALCEKIPYDASRGSCLAGLTKRQ